jgi:hypothetical protein
MTIGELRKALETTCLADEAEVVVQGFLCNYRKAHGRVVAACRLDDGTGRLVHYEGSEEDTPLVGVFVFD